MDDNQPRLHMDPRRAKAPPPLDEIRDWCYDVVSGAEGGGARDAMSEAARMVAATIGHAAAVRDVSRGAALGLRRAAGEIHDLAREFGFDPRLHADTAEVVVQLCILRASIGAHPQGAILERQAVDMWRGACVLVEMRAVTALSLGMLSDGMGDAATLADVALDARPETVEMIRSVTGLVVPARPPDAHARQS